MFFAYVRVQILQGNLALGSLIYVHQRKVNVLAGADIEGAAAGINHLELGLSIKNTHLILL